MKKIIYTLYIFLFFSFNLTAFDKNIAEFSLGTKYNLTPSSDIDNYLSNGFEISFLPEETEGVIDYFSFEYHYAQIDFCDADCGDLDNNLNQYIFNAEHFFQPQSYQVIPFALAGIGYFDYKYTNSEVEDKKDIHYGAGLRVRLNTVFGLKTSLRHSILFNSEVDYELSFTFGLFFGFLPKNSILIDHDRDGVEDYLDECFDTPFGAIVDEYGCRYPKDEDYDGVLDSYDECKQTPLGIEVNSVGCPADADDDGVFDYMDKCPKTSSNIEVDAVGCPLDSDHDGTFDTIDRCPNTPPNTIVSTNGCELKEDKDLDGVPDDIDKCIHTAKGVEVTTEGCPVDKDNDGVLDIEDHCPNTPEGTIVDIYGCGDFDYDGVSNFRDKCPNTPIDTEVDEYGCPFSVTLNIKFTTNSSYIFPTYRKDLNGFIDYFNKYLAEYGAEVQGHTDSVGTAYSNKLISESRAKSVYNYLIQNGVNAKRLNYKGYGESTPIADNETPEGREKNRRVEIRLFLIETPKMILSLDQL